MCSPNGGSECFGPGSLGRATNLRSNRDALLRDISALVTADRDKQGEVVVICSERYMDAEGLLSALYHKTLEVGGTSFFYDFVTASIADAVAELGRIGRRARAAAANGLVSVCLNGLPKCDESSVLRVVRPLNEMASRGCLVFVAVEPEQMYLVEGIHGSRIYHSRDLSAVPWPNSTDRYRELYARTHGIPALVAVCKRLGRVPEADLQQNLDYIAALSSCTDSFVRRTLINEERRVRCALALMGSGTFDELRPLVGEKSMELLKQISIDSSYVDVSLDQKRFSCVGVDRTEGLNAVYRILSDACDDFPQLALGVSELLVRRGETERAAITCLMVRDEDDRKLLVIREATKFFNAGEFSLLRDSVDDPPIAAFNELEIVENAHLLAESIGENSRPTEVSLPDVNTCGQSVLAGALATRFRAILEGDRLDTSVPTPPGAGPELAQAAISTEAFRRMANGDFKSAYSLLLDGVSDMEQGPNRLVSSVTALIYGFSATMIGVSLTLEERDWITRSRSFFEASGLDLARTACDALYEVVGLVSGRATDVERLESLSRKAKHSGLTVVHAYCLIAESVSDLRDGSAIRAFVRTKGAEKEVARAGMANAAGQMRILLAAIGDCLGETVPIDRDAATPSPSAELEQVGNLARVAHAIVSNGRENLVESGLGVAPTSSRRESRLGGLANVLWLIDVLSKDCGEFSKAFQALLPGTWNKALIQFGLVEPPEAAVNDGVEAQPASADAYQQYEEGPEGIRVDISLLGRFSLRINGREVDPRNFERRRAKSLLTLLALVPDHSMRRYAAIESVWPELDYESGTRRVYEATSVLRNKFASIGGSKVPKPLLSNRMDHSLALNPDCVRVDVDQFVAVAQRALDSEGNDRLVVALCRQAEGYYQGDLVIPPNDGRGVAHRRKDQLQGLFADAMVAGSNAAMRLGLKLTAVRFARRAYAANGEREDAITCLMRALVATGRSFEAEREYRAFAVRAVEKGHRPPSRELRKLARDLLGSKDDSSQGQAPKRSGERPPIGPAKTM